MTVKNNKVHVVNINTAGDGISEYKFHMSRVLLTNALLLIKWEIFLYLLSLDLKNYFGDKYTCLLLVTVKVTEG